MAQLRSSPYSGCRLLCRTQALLIHSEFNAKAQSPEAAKGGRRKLQAANSKLHRNPKAQAPTSYLARVRRRFGAWGFAGTWGVELGVSGCQRCPESATVQCARTLQNQTNGFTPQGMKRSYEDLLLAYLKAFPCVALIGVRQCGKTTLLQALPSGWMSPCGWKCSSTVTQAS